MKKMKRIIRGAKFLARPIREIATKRYVRKNNIYLNYVKHASVKENTVFLESYHAVNQTGNVLAIYQKMIQEYPNFTYYWAYKGNSSEIPVELKEDSKKYNVHIIRYESVAYFKALATSKYLINDTSFMPYFLKRKNQIYMNTWHGTPLKTLGLDIKDAGRANHKNIQRNLLQADILAMPNLFTANKLIRSHDLGGIFPNKVMITGNARVDNTLGTLNDDSTGQIKSRLGLPDEKIILYAPTWKKDIKYTTDTDILSLIDEVKQLQEKAQGYKVLLKVHYFVYETAVKMGYGDYLVSNTIDTNTLLRTVDMLITDYSSIFFDYLPLKRPVMFYVPDKISYAKRRGFYKDLDTLPGYVTDRFSDVVDKLSSLYIHTWKVDYEKKYNAYQEEFLYKDDGKAATRCVKALMLGNQIQPDVDYFNFNNDKKKLLIYGGGFYNNGITNSVINLANTLDSNKYELVFVDYPKMRPEKLYNMNRLPANVHFIFNFSWASRTVLDTYAQNIAYHSGFSSPMVPHKRMIKSYRFNFKRVFGNFIPDEVIDFGGYNKAITGLFVLSDVKKKVIFLHNTMMNEYDKVVNGKYKHRANLRVIFSYYKYFDKIISVSESANQQNSIDLASYADESKFTWVENLVNGAEIENQIEDVKAQLVNGKKLIDFSEDETDSGIVTTRSFHPIDQEYFNFVTVARLSPEKNHVGLIRAFKRVHDYYDYARLYIIGEGPLRKELEFLVSDLGLDDSVFIMGFIENPAKFIYFADYIVLPSIYEGQGLALLEAMIANKPVMGTNVPGIQDALHHGEYGLLTSENAVNNLNSLANTMSLAIELKDNIKYENHYGMPEPMIYLDDDDQGNLVRDAFNSEDVFPFELRVGVDDAGMHYVKVADLQAYPKHAVFINGQRLNRQPDGRYCVPIGASVLFVPDMGKQAVFKRFDWRSYDQRVLQEFEEKAIL